MTREEAVKRVLLVVGENPITVSPNDEVYQMAQQLLDMITLDVLGMGWRFNTHYLEDGTEAIDTYVVDVDDYTTEEDLFNANFAAIPVHIQQVIVARTSYEFSLGYTGENLFSEDLSKMYLMALQQARGTEVMLSAELIDFERIYKNVASQLLNEEGWWWNTTETGEDFQTNIPLNLPPIADSYAKIKAQRLFQAYNTANVELMLNPTPEEKEIYAQMVKQNRRHFLRSLPVEELRDSYINELRAEGITSALTYDEARFSDALAASYADIKAKRMYMLVTEEVNREAYINPSQDEINLYTRLKARQLNKVSHFDDLEALTQEIEDQLKNEIGWYFNTELDEFGQKKLKEVIVLPEEVKAYAKLKARRLFNAFQRTGGDANIVNTPTPEETQAYQQLWLKNHSYWLESETLEQFRDSIIQSLNSEGLTQYLSYSIETNGLIKHYANLKAKRLYSLYNSIDPTPFINATKEEEDLYKRILIELNKPTKVNESDIAEAVASLTKVPANDPSIVHYARMKANRINYSYETGNMELLINMPPEELQAYQAILLKSKREKFNITLENLYNEILNSVLAMFPNINKTNATVVEYANLKSRRLYALYTELDPNFAQQPNDETQLLQELYRQNLASLESETLEQFRDSIIQSLNSEGLTQYLSYSIETNGLIKHYANLKAKRLYSLYNSIDPTPFINATKEEEDLYKRILIELNKPTKVNESDIAEAVASLTKVPANDPSIVHYARMKANRINYSYETGNMELLINMPPEELQAYQAILLKSKREKFNITLENLYNEILNSVLAMFPNINKTNATVVEYANLKSRRLYALYTELDPNFAQQPNDETQLLQELYRQNLTSELQQTTYDDVLTAIRQQLLNEAGWWYNTSTDANGNLITRIPDTLPEIVEQYAVARAKRLYRAYQNNQMELILNPSPEEQELYSKMLEMHNRVTRGGKSLEQLKKDILTEVLLEGWSFNIKEQPYREIKAANLVLLKATALYPQLNVYVDKDNKIIDHKTYAEIPEETVVQVVHKVAYDELPELFKLYIDMKASRMYNYYNTINSQINSPLAWARPTADELLLFQKLKTLYAVDIENANILENDTLQYWGRRYR